LDKEGPGVVDFWSRSFVFIDILALFPDSSRPQTRLHAKAQVAKCAKDAKKTGQFGLAALRGVAASNLTF
jgi:hypothetical protein